MYRSIFLNLAWFPLQVILRTIRSPAFRLLSPKTRGCCSTPLILSHSSSYPSAFAVSISCQIYLKSGHFSPLPWLLTLVRPPASLIWITARTSSLNSLPLPYSPAINPNKAAGVVLTGWSYNIYIFKNSLVSSKSSNGFSPLPRVKSLRGLQ